jgi:HNH endonuclease
MDKVGGELIADLIAYDPETGAMTWKRRDKTSNGWNTKFSGRPALATLQQNGYLGGMLMDSHALAHRVAWAAYYGKWPSGVIDHINGNKQDNRISNLRDVDNTTNLRNRKKMRSNTSGTTGVHYSKADGKWIARIGVLSGHAYLGSFDSKEDAIAGRQDAARRLGFADRHGI